MSKKKYKQCGIYCYHNIVNGKNYVGQSVDLVSRHQDFTKNRVYSGKAFQNAINKYGKENFQYSVLTHCKEEELNFFEAFYIARLKTTDRRYGYNSTSGGDSKGRLTDDAKKHMSDAWTEERRKEKSKEVAGVGNPFFGCKHTKEVCEILSETRKKYGEKKISGDTWIHFT